MGACGSQAERLLASHGDPFSVLGVHEDEQQRFWLRAWLPGAAQLTVLDARSGEIIKVKYGASRERQGEIAATRLLYALGFGADRVMFVNREATGSGPELSRGPSRSAKLATRF